ncbi:hypothetical protein [Lentzea pudingi]|uniref:hypothetical protein n=1 Tax=Lentzea pudingi TaxID=1789439 RepID=UPI0016642258|nr:hypothetical protein [Lentzea pudingi]
MTIWVNVIAVSSPVIALGSALVAVRSSRIARRSLELARRTGQASYESAKLAQSCVATLVLSEVEFRRATARDWDGILGAEARRSLHDEDADSLEVVVRGRLISNVQHEVLLTCRDHSRAGRDIWYSHRNQSVFLLGEKEVELGNAILSGGETVEFTWIDRRSRAEWIDIHNLGSRNPWGDPELELPRLTWWEKLMAGFRGRDFELVRRHKVKRVGFRVVCEPRIVPRVATVWLAEVTMAAVVSAGRDEAGRVAFEDRIQRVPGPIDDAVIRYRGGFDATLALVDPPRWLNLVGRD